MPTSAPVNAPVNPSTETPVTAPVTSADFCCSQDYKACVDWCGNTLSSCQVCAGASIDFVWISTAETESCLARWSVCEADNDGDQGDCCPGLLCYGSPWYKQCLPAL